MRRSAFGTLVVATSLLVTACGSGPQSSSSTSTAGSSASASGSAGSAAASAGSAAASSGASSAPWAYSGPDGPDNWGASYPACASTPESTESPIDIELAALAAEPTEALAVDYGPTHFEAENLGTTIEAVPQHAEHASITLAGTTYNLAQFHFHAHSEHQIDGANAPLELHIVNKTPDGSAAAVLGVLLQTGEPNGELGKVFDSMAKLGAKGDAVELDEPIDLTAVLPADGKIAQYDGSLTTPPCTAGIRWNVFLTPVTVSAEQLAAFTALYPDNSRPLQPLNGRTVVHATIGG